MLKYLPLILILSSCAHTWNPLDYGVYPQQPIGSLVAISELFDSEIHRICGKGKSGCVKQQGKGYAIYYRNGDECALRHELMHIMYGLKHTVAYMQRVISNVPNPGCPQ